MKNKVYVLVSVCVVVGLSVLSQPVQAQQEMPLSYLVEEVRMVPDKAAEYEEFIKRFIDICKQYKWPYSVSTYATYDNLLYLLYPAKNFSEVDQIFNSWYAVLDKYGEDKWQTLAKKYADTFEYMRFGMIHRLPELSYQPQALVPGEEPFTYWGYLYVKPGMEKEVEAIFKEIVALFKQKKTTNAFIFWAVDYGLELPCYFYAMSGKTASEIFARGEKAHEIADTEINALWAKITKCLRRYEYKIGEFRPDLSYIPEKK
jgi:hypothetical protein